MILRIVGNASSPHVKLWLRVLKSEFQLSLYDVNRTCGPAIEDSGIQAEAPLRQPSLRRFKILQYLILGLWLKSQRLPGLIHAHNTSGYGLSALLSGNSYIVTTYGSEIYEASNRGTLYSMLIKRVLSNASLITASTDYMAEVLETKFSISRDKIFCRMLLDPLFAEVDETTKASGRRTWFVNRRMTELYRTLDVVSAFNSFLELGGEGNLVLLEGDADRSYAQRVSAAIGSNPNIRTIKGIIGQSQMICELNAAHFAISVPLSDQLSSAILEAAACGTVPIIRNLPSYRAVSPICVTVDEESGAIAALTHMFTYTSSLPNEQLLDMASRARKFVLKEFSHQSFVEQFKERVNALS